MSVSQQDITCNHAQIWIFMEVFQKHIMGLAICDGEQPASNNWVLPTLSPHLPRQYQTCDHSVRKGHEPEITCQRKDSQVSQPGGEDGTGPGTAPQGQADQHCWNLVSAHSSRKLREAAQVQCSTNRQGNSKGGTVCL